MKHSTFLILGALFSTLTLNATELDLTVGGNFANDEGLNPFMQVDINSRSSVMNKSYANIEFRKRSDDLEAKQRVGVMNEEGYFVNYLDGKVSPEESRLGVSFGRLITVGTNGNYIELEGHLGKWSDNSEKNGGCLYFCLSS